MVYGKTVRSARVKSGITQLQLGKLIGKSKQWVSEFERGNIRLTMDIAVQLANALGSSPDIFLPNKAKNVGQTKAGANEPP